LNWTFAFMNIQNLLIIPVQAHNVTSIVPKYWAYNIKKSSSCYLWYKHQFIALIKLKRGGKARDNMTYKNSNVSFEAFPIFHSQFYSKRHTCVLSVVKVIFLFCGKKSLFLCDCFKISTRQNIFFGNFCFFIGTLRQIWRNLHVYIIYGKMVWTIWDQVLAYIGAIKTIWGSCYHTHLYNLLVTPVLLKCFRIVTSTKMLSWPKKLPWWEEIWIEWFVMHLQTACLRSSIKEHLIK